MEFSPTFYGGYVDVSLSCTSEFYCVVVRGGDDCMLGRFFDNYCDAIQLFNSIRYLQGESDLVEFRRGVAGENNNGWPHMRIVHLDNFTYPRPVDYLSAYVMSDEAPESYNWGGPRKKL